MSNKSVLISNSALNANGFRVLTSGIDLTQYRRNPILLFMHRRPLGGNTDQILPLGHVENIEVKDDALYGDVVIEPVDEFGEKVKKQWENGTLKMVSPCFEEMEWSEDPQYLLPGQRYPTVTKCKLTEVSIVDIGANDDALQLRDKSGNVICLAKLSEFTKPLNIEPIKTTEQMELKEIALALGLAENATAEQIAERCASLCEEVATLEKDAETVRLSRMTELVSAAIAAKKIAADKKEHFISLGKMAGIDALKLTLDAIAPMKEVRPSVLLKNGTTPVYSDHGDRKTLYDMSEDQIRAIMEDDEEEYARLYKQTYGVELVNMK